MAEGEPLPNGTVGRKTQWLEGGSPKSIKREDIPQQLLELVNSMTNEETLRFLEKVEYEDGGRGHWLWKGWVNEKGYGRFDLFREVDGRWMRFKPYAHRLAYVLYHGVDLAGLELNHKCGIVECVNPAHLEALTWPEHVLRFELTYEEMMAEEIPL